MNIFKKTERRQWVEPLRLYYDFDSYMNQLADALLSLDKDPFTGLLPLFFSFALYYMYSWICFVCFNPCYGDFCTALCVPTSIHAKILAALKKITVATAINDKDTQTQELAEKNYILSVGKESTFSEVLFFKKA